MLTLNDGRNELWQWDTGRKLTVDADCTQVHFSNKFFGRSVDVDVFDGTAEIPDVLLQVDKDLLVWAFVGTAENGYTKISKVFKVNKRNKPADYVFTPPEQTTLGQIMERLDDLEAMQDPDAIKNAVDDYLANNPIKVEEKDPTVPDWAKQTTKPKYTATEVGAVAKVNGVSPDTNGNVEITVSGSGGNVELDTTLTQSGKAADAKATGNALTALEKKIYENSETAYSIFTGKTASFYGDSLTEVNQHYTKGYHKWISETLGLASYNNYGVSGYKVADVLNKVNSVNDTSDIIFVMIGVNDVQFDTPLGTLTGLETGTVYGNLNALCAKLRKKYPEKLLTFITPAEQTRYPGTIGVSMHDIMKATKEVCEKYSIVVYDCFTYSEICTANLSYWTVDDCHWNDKAHEMVGKNLAHFVRNTFRYIPGASESTTTLNSITATFNQGEAVIYDTDTLDSLKQYLTVTAHYSNGTTAPVTGYTLVGKLSEGTSTIAVSYGGKSASFTVEVTHNSESGGDSGDSGTEDDATGFVGKTFRTKGYYVGKYNFTTLVGVDSDFVKGNTVEVNLSGSDAVNIVSGSGYSGMWGDETGACSNSAINGQYAVGGQKTVTVDEEGNVAANISHAIVNDVTTPYLKVNFILTPNSTAESISFTIDQISVTVNGNEKEILDIGGFYEEETCELV